MIALIWSLRIAGRRYRRTDMPTHIAIDLLCTGFLKWGIPTALVILAVYPSAASVLTARIDNGGPGWLNILVLLSAGYSLNLADLRLVAVTRLPRVVVRQVCDGFTRCREQLCSALTPDGIAS
jgi:hypothetical protein